MNAAKPRVGVLGGHTAFARALRTLFDEREPDAALDLASSTDRIEEGLVLQTRGFIEEVDALVLADPAAKELALAASCPVLDVCGAFESNPEIPWLWPYSALSPARAKLPTGIAGALAVTLRALGDVRAVRIATYESAATRDREGIDALAEQARSIFTLRDVRPEPFSAQLAFSILGDEDPAPMVTRLRAATDGLSNIEVSRALVSSFSVEAAVLFVDLAETAGREDVEARLAKAAGIRVRKTPPPALDVVDRDDVSVSVLAAADGRARLWVAADRLRSGGPTPAFLWIERTLSALSGKKPDAPAVKS